MSYNIPKNLTAILGTILQGQGVGTPSAYSTATYPSSSVGSGKILYDNGTNFVTSTPTFPASASATTRKIIVSDGTNWTASTETYATPSNANNLMQSDGTNWTSAAPVYIATATGTLTNVNIKALHGTPKSVIAAQGSGKVICVLSCQIKMNFGGSNVFTAGAAQTINLYYGTTNSILIGLTNAQIVASSSQFSNCPALLTQTANSTLDNVAVNFYNPVATEITGNAGANNTVTYRVVYAIVSI